MKLVRSNFKLWGSVWDVYATPHDEGYYFQNTYSKKWIVPAHLKYFKYRYPIKINELFNIIYGEHLPKLTGSNPFLKMIPKGY